MEDTLDELYSKAVRMAEDTMTKFEVQLNEIESNFRQAFENCRKKAQEDQEIALKELKSKLSVTYLLEQFEGEGDVLEQVVAHISRSFSPDQWMKWKSETKPDFSALPKLVVSSDMIDQKVTTFKNYQLLTKEGPLDPFLVEVVNVVDPYDFYIHRFCDDEKRKALQHILNHDTFPEPMKIQEGEIYGVFVQNLKSWLRGQCGSMCGNYQVGNGPCQLVYECFLIDEGCYEKIPSSQFRELPEIISRLAPLALNCSLNPIPGREWSSKDVVYFKKLASRSPLNMHVLKSEGSLVVDLEHVARFVDEERIVSFRDAMMMMQASTSQDLRYRPNITDVPHGMCLEGTVVSVTSPNRIYISFEVEENRTDYDAMMEELQTKFDTGRGSPAVEIRIGHPYAFRWTDGRWYRVMVEEINRSHGVTLYFVDVGQRVITSSCYLRELPRKYLQVPARVTCCKLCSVLKFDNKKAFSSASINFLQQRLVGVRVTAYFFGKHEGSVGAVRKREMNFFVVLYVGEEELSVNEQFVEARYGRAGKAFEPNPRFKAHPPTAMKNADAEAVPSTDEAIRTALERAVANRDGSSWLDSLIKCEREREPDAITTNGVTEVIVEPIAGSSQNQVAVPAVENGTNRGSDRQKKVQSDCGPPQKSENHPTAKLVSADSGKALSADAFRAVLESAAANRDGSSWLDTLIKCGREVELDDIVIKSVAGYAVAQSKEVDSNHNMVAIPSAGNEASGESDPPTEVQSDCDPRPVFGNVATTALDNTDTDMVPSADDALRAALESAAANRDGSSWLDTLIKCGREVELDSFVPECVIGDVVAESKEEDSCRNPVAIPLPESEASGGSDPQTDVQSDCASQPKFNGESAAALESADAEITPDTDAEIALNADAALRAVLESAAANRDGSSWLDTLIKCEREREPDAIMTNNVIDDVVAESKEGSRSYLVPIPTAESEASGVADPPTETQSDCGPQSVLENVLTSALDHTDTETVPGDDVAQP